ncbi:acetyltransferase [Parabacteroides sp. ZJ-118]|uniref:acetyltransferase n=1 Tax=Parabacteroides sp. ZJ-118 TaxID=2709398 RepID=UPI0013ED0DF8|nr:acetyltransferase [Parabacteroides sp. ZJ-118]
MKAEVKDIAIYGAGGFGRETACLLRMMDTGMSPRWNFIGFFDDGITFGTENEYGKVLGNIDTLNSWNKPLAIVFAIGSPKTVESLYSKVANANIDFPNIIGPGTIFVDKDNVKIGKGNIIGGRCSISCNVEIGNFNTFNGNVIIGHDAIIGNYNSIMPSCNISGGVMIGNRNFIGVNSVILQYKTIADDCVIGASSVVMRNIKQPGTYVGNPANKLEF